jgi:transposase
LAAPARGNDKGKVEGLVKYARSNFLTPIPVAASFDDLNATLAEHCRARQAGSVPHNPSAHLRGHVA